MSAPADPRHHDLIIAASLLEQGGRIDALARGLTLAGVVGLVWFAGQVPLGVLICLGALVVLGLYGLYLAIRVGLDAALFRHLADGDMAGFDAAMMRQGLLPAAKAGRPVADRIAGARGLLRRQVTALVGQLGFAIAIAVVLAAR